MDGGARLPHLSAWASKISDSRECVPGIDLGKNLGLDGIVVGSQLAIFYAEPIAPECEMSDCRLFS
jgi:hypothetical protein